MTKPEPALVLWAALIGGALAGDVWLLRNGHRPLTHLARSTTGRTLRAVVELHFEGRLGRLDPFTYAATRITRSPAPCPTIP